MWEIVGFESAKGVTKSTGEAWEGYRIFCQRCRPRDGVEGTEVCVEFYKISRIQYIPALGDRVLLEHNQFGLSNIEVM